MTDFPVKNKPPHNVSVLERWLTEASKQSGAAAGRLRRWLGFSSRVVSRWSHVGLTGPDTVPCVAVRWQVAQKLRACTEVPAMGENDRFRDLIDLQLLAGLIDEQRWPDVRIACIAVFEG